MGCTCSGNSNGVLVFSCSGAADVGSLSDRTARLLRNLGVAEMSCTPLVALQNSGTIKKVESASRVVLLDGCPVDCCRKLFENVSHPDIRHFRLTDMGFVKGQTVVDDPTVRQLTGKIATEIIESCC